MSRHRREGRSIDQTNTAVLPVVVDEMLAGGERAVRRQRGPLERVADKLTVRSWLLVVPPIALAAFTASYIGFAPDTQPGRGVAVVSPSTAAPSAEPAPLVVPSPTVRADRARPRRAAPQATPSRVKPRRTARPAPTPARTSKTPKPSPTPDETTTPPTTPEPLTPGGDDDQQ